MLLKIHPDNPSSRKIEQVTKTLEKGGVIIYPTDSVYGLGCDIFNHKAVDKICRLRKLNPAKANLTFICIDIAQLSEYTVQLNNTLFKLLRRNTPGPFTFIFSANNKVPKLFKNRKKTVGIRIPENNIARDIVENLGRPILSLSLKSEDEIVEYYTDPFDINEDFQNQVDIVIDGGMGNHEPSTVVDCTGDEPEVIRKGAKELV